MDSPDSSRSIRRKTVFTGLGKLFRVLTKYPFPRR
jgi:hypothetical protein